MTFPVKFGLYFAAVHGQLSRVDKTHVDKMSDPLGSGILVSGDDSI
jgi:hypothetical protein